MLGWFEVSPGLAVDTAFNDRGFELSVSEVYYQQGAIDRLQEYLTTEPLVETSCVVHRSIFLYNLNHREPDFNVVSPQLNQSDFYISRDDLSNGAFFVNIEFLHYILPLMQFEPGSQVSFNISGNEKSISGIIISRRILQQIEKKTNDTYKIGDTIDFSIARQFLPDYYVYLDGFNPLAFSDLTINAIYERIPSDAQIFFGLDFRPETLGDGLFLSSNLLSENVIYEMEDKGFFPSLYIRVRREEIARYPQTAEGVEEITFFAQRIIQQGHFKVELKVQDSQGLLYYFDQSRIVSLLMLFPLFLLAEVFFLALIPHLLNNRRQEFYYLKLRGTSNKKLLILVGSEFAFLMSLSFLFGVIGGGIFLDVLISAKNFLELNEFMIGNSFSLLARSNTGIWITGAISILVLNYCYFQINLWKLLRRTQQEGIPLPNRFLTSQSLIRNSLKLIIVGLSAYLTFITIGPRLLKIFGVSGTFHQFIPLIILILMLTWIFFSLYVPQLLLRIAQALLETFKVFTNPRMQLNWLNLFRRRTQFLSLLTILTLAISLLSFNLIYVTTLQAHLSKNASFVTGGDIKCLTDSTDVSNFTSQAQTISGVDLCVGLPKETVILSKYFIILIGINPQNYSKIANSYPLSIIDGPPEQEVWHSLYKDPLHAVIVNSFLATIFRWEVGTNIPILKPLPTNGIQWNLSISAIMSSAPGIGTLYQEEYIPGTQKFGGYAIVHEDLLRNFGNTEASTFLISINSSDQQTTVSTQLQEISEVRAISYPSSAIEYQQNIFKLVGVHGIITLNCVGAFLINLLGIAVFYQYLIDERLSELAIYQAFGATKRKLSRMVFFEILFLITIGLSLGVMTGDLFALGFLLASRIVIISPNSSFLLELVVSPYLMTTTLSLITIGIIMTAVIPLKKIFTLEITQVLRRE